MRTIVLWALACALATAGAAPPRKAATRRPARPAATAAARPAAAPVQTAHRRSPYAGAISVNAATGEVIFEDHADAEAYPASVTKLMTLLLVVEDVKAGRYSYDEKVEATADAYRSEPSWIGIKVGEKMTVRDLCISLMVESANDAAIVLGVHSAGSFDAFVARMNARAAELGMSRTRYYNPNGLPPNARRHYPWKSFNVTTARDQVALARELAKVPEVLTFTSIKTCDLVKTADGFRVAVTRRANEPNATTVVASGEMIVKQFRNHNNVMVKDKKKIFNPDGREAVDGLKTGYIDAGGSSIVLTGARKGKRAIVVVLGSTSADERDEHAARLLGDVLGALAW